MKFFKYTLIFILISTVAFLLINNFYSKENIDFNLDTLKKEQLKKNNNTSLKKLSNNNSKKINIAILDSGIDYTHPDFEYSIFEGVNILDEDELAYDNYIGHGTSITGIIGAKDNAIGIRGLCPNENIFPVKVIDYYGQVSISNIIKAVDWCIDNQINIINMSFSVNNDNLLLKNAIDKAIDNGIIIIASASSNYGGDVGYPAKYNDVISVRAVNEEDYSTTTNSKGKIDFSAPGVDVISLQVNNSYDRFSGNSIATAYITGLSALIMKNPKYFNLNENPSIKEIYSALVDISIDIGETGYDAIYGNGIPVIK